MATLYRYRCEDCGYQVDTDPRGHYSLFRGEIYVFRCNCCDEIVGIKGKTIGEHRYSPKCPRCDSDGDSLYSWNPVDGKCPKCAGEMVRDNSLIMDAD